MSSTPTAPSATTLHYARRMSWGCTPTLAAEISAAGGGRPWLVAQLSPSTVTDTAGSAVSGWFPSLAATPAQLYARNATQPCWQAMQDLSRWTMARRIVSKRQVLEMMVDFWSDLLHVPLMDDSAMYWRIDYDTVVRRYALGTFSDLLTNAVLHPAMGLYLDNASSTATAPNENLGRELLELHTVGADSGYTEADVKSSARILTGYRADVWYPAFQSFYDTTRHYVGPVTVLGFSSANASSDGRAVTTAYLSYLARHPSTAKRLARRLCQRFVSDNPSNGLVSYLASVYLANGTAIVPTLLAMVDHPEFLASAGLKVRTPVDDHVASVRALQVGLVAPTSDSGFARAMYTQYKAMGQAPFEWPSPNGFPIDSASWCSAGRVLTSMAAHRDLAGQYFPSKDATFRTFASWLPTLPASLDGVLTSIGTTLLGQPPSTALKTGIAQALGMSLTHQLTASEGASYWTVRTILTSMLDSPQHLTR